MVPGILFDAISAPHCYEAESACLCCPHEKGNKGACYILIAIHYIFSSIFFFNPYKIMGCYICLILNLKQSHNLELKKPVLIFG